jgi:hypothetical protein
MSAVFASISTPLLAAGTASQALSSIPGLPPLPPSVNLSSFSIPSLSSFESAAAGASPLPQSQSQAPQWGVFDVNNNPAITAYDSMITFEYQTEMRMLSYPIEDGAFETYDKVKVPDHITIRFSCGQTQDMRSQLIAELQELRDNFDLYSVVTPTITFVSMSMSGFRYRHDLASSNMIVVDCIFEQVVATASATYTTVGALDASNVTSPTSADPVSGGSVGLQVPGTSQWASSSPFNLPTDISGAISGTTSQIGSLTSSVQSQFSAISGGSMQSLIPSANTGALASVLNISPPSIGGLHL